MPITADPQNADTLDGNGIDCITTERIAYEGAGPNALTAGSTNINVNRAPNFYTDNIDAPTGTQWQTVNPFRGARVGLASGAPMAENGAGSVFPLGAGTSFYRWLGTVAGANYSTQTRFVALANTDNEITHYLRYVDNNNHIKITYIPATTTWTLVEVIAGVPNVLDTQVVDLVAAGPGGIFIWCRLNGTAITFPAGGGVFTGPYVTAHTTAGPFGYFVDANAADVTGFNGDQNALHP